MANGLNTFPLILAVREDGALNSTTRNIESFLTASADRTGRAFVAAGNRANSAFNLTGARREVEKFVASSSALLNQKSTAAADPLGIRAGLASLSSSPIQRVINEQVSAEQSLATQRARARDEHLAGVQRQADAAIAGIRAETAARTAAFQQAANEGNALAALQRQQVEQAAGYLSRQTGPTLTLDPAGARTAATAARQQAVELEAVARAAEHSRDSAVKATAADLNLATASRTAADAAKQHAGRLAEVATAEQRTLEILKSTTGAIERQTVATSRMSLLRKQTLVYTASDVVASLGSGSDPFRILLQQGPQVAQVLALQEGGLKSVLNVLTPTRLAVGGLAAAVAIGSKAWLDYRDSMGQAEALAKGIGGAAGLTGGQIAAVATAAADAATITVGAAREIEVAYLRAGRFSETVMTSLIAVTKDYAAASGSDLKTAANDLATAFASPAAGAETLATKMGILDQAGVLYIQTLVEQNRNTEAQTALLSALSPALADAAANTGLLQRGFERIAAAASSAFEQIGKAIDRIVTGGSAADKIRDLMKQRERGPSVGQLLTGTSTAEYQADIDRQIEGERYKLRQETARAARQQANSRSQSTAVMVDGYTGANELRRLKQQQAQVRQTLNDPQQSLPPEQRKQTVDYYNALTRAVQTYIPEQQKAVRLAQVDAAIATATTPARKAALAAERERINIAGKVITATDAAAIATANGARASTAAARAADSHTSALRRRAEAFAQEQAGDADKVQRIAERFDKQPTLVDQSKAAVRDLDEMIAKYGKLSDAMSKSIVAKARLASVTVDAAPQAAIELATKEMSDQLFILQLTAEGREAEANALQDKLALLKRIGVELGKETPRQAAAISGFDAAREKRDRATFDGRFSGDERAAATDAEALRAEIAGRQDIADLLREQARYEADGTRLNAVQLEQLRKRLATEYELTRQAEAHARLIDIQVGAARDLQAALNEALTDPFKKGSLNNLDNAISSIRKSKVAQELSIKLFGEMGSDVERALTRGSAPLHTAADDLRVSAKDLSAAARAQGAAASAPTRNPSVAQLTTTPTAYGVARGSGLQVGPDDIVVPGRRTTEEFFAGTPSPFAEPTLKPDLTELSNQLRLSAKANVNDRIVSTLDRFQMPLTYLASAVGGKAGGVINSIANIPEYEKIGETIGRSLGNSQAGAAIGAGVGAGQASDQLLKAIGVKSSKLGASIGGAIGNAILPGIGGFIGGAIGGAVGGLFKKSKFASSDLSINNGVASAGSATGRGGKELTTANALGGSLAGSLNSLAQSLGATLGSAAVSIGYRPGHKAPAYRVDPTGRGQVANGSVQAFETEEEAVAYAIRDAINDGVLKGVRASTQRLLSAGADLQAQLSKALAFENVFVELKQFTDPVGAAIDALDKQFASLRTIFAEAGASTDEYSQLEQLYALKRADAVKAAAKDVTSTLQGLLDDLRYKGDTGLSLRTREQAAAAAFNPLAATVRAGGVVDQNDFSDKARALLDIQRQLYGSTNAYFDRLAGITNLTAKAIANAGGTVTTITSQVETAAQKAALAPANDNAAAYRTANTAPIATAIQASFASPAQSAAAAQAPFNTAEMVQAIGQQTAALQKGLDEQTATTRAGFELLIGTTARLGGTGGPSTGAGLTRTLRTA